MIRRRHRPNRQIPFSFESFLDIVANVVGIIIRLILVAWIGARTYKAVVPMPPPPEPPPAFAEPAPLPDPTDPRLEQIARRREELSREERAELARQRGLGQAAHDEADRVRGELAEVAARRAALQQEQGQWQARAEEQGKAAKGILLSLDELRRRSDKLLAELKKAEQGRKPPRELRYHTPVSAVVQTEELMFECKQGRVTLLDTAALLEQIRRAIGGKADALRDRFQVTDVTRPVGAFRLRYVVERERTALDGPGGIPGEGTYRYGLSAWEAEPVEPRRGESADEALKEGSAFRKLVDELDPQQTVVTFWVYPDSFALYRRLRDHLHGRDVVVAGRPLPDGVPIASSRQGTASRGQ